MKMKRFFNNLFTPEEQKTLIFIIILFLLGVGSKFIRAENKLVQKKDIDSLNSALKIDYEIKYDIRTATKEELMNIKGIGENTAQRILNYRKEKRFMLTSDIMKVKGIGPKKYEKMKEQLLLFDDSAGCSDEMKSEKFNNEVEEVFVEKININTANIDELSKLKGIGSTKANRIIEYRNKVGKFNNINELANIKGIGVKTIEKIKKNLTVN